VVACNRHPATRSDRNLTIVEERLKRHVDVNLQTKDPVLIGLCIANAHGASMPHQTSRRMSGRSVALNKAYLFRARNSLHSDQARGAYSREVCIRSEQANLNGRLQYANRIGYMRRD
jgi:hypothetical protein